MTLPEAIALQQRDPQTGLRTNITYRFRDDGSIDWLSMVERKHLFVVDKHKDKVIKAQGKPIDECDLSLVDERWLRVKQAGWNQLANLRGYHNLDYHSVTAADGKSAMVCVIEWIGNYETQMESFTCAGVASASSLTVDHGFRPYLETFAENRSFARAVKRALQINAYSEDEIDEEALKGIRADDSAPSATTGKPKTANGWDILKTFCANHKPVISFEAIKASAVKHNAKLDEELAARTANPADTTLPNREDERIKSDPSSWVDWTSVQDTDVWLLTGKIKEADEAAAKGVKTKR